MNLIEFIYRIIREFAGLSQGKAATLQAKAAEKLGTLHDTDNKFLKMLYEYNEHFLTETILAILYIIVSNSLLNSMHRGDDDEVYDEFEEDEDKSWRRAA